MKIGQLVKIEWVDSHVIQGWQFETQINDMPHCYSVGYLDYIGDDVIKISPTISDSGGKLSTMLIPRGAVINTKELRVK